MPSRLLVSTRRTAEAVSISPFDVDNFDFFALVNEEKQHIIL
ncbi:MbtH family protein [Mycobacterium mantenii]|nr:MbtH family protein [Mycobacterium mantenii]